MKLESNFLNPVYRDYIVSSITCFLCLMWFFEKEWKLKKLITSDWDNCRSNRDNLQSLRNLLKTIRAVKESNKFMAIKRILS